MKYDCNKVLDCKHELKRLCASYVTCSAGCPLKPSNCELKAIEQEDIDILQKWSDEHPEPPKLTKKDRMFLECFEGVSGRKICKDSDGCAFYNYSGISSFLSEDMFKALEPSTTMTFEELLKLEVEE